MATNDDMEERCPHFDTCSCNKCPLSKDYQTLEALPGEEACTLARYHRHRLWSAASSEQKRKGALKRLYYKGVGLETKGS